MTRMEMGVAGLRSTVERQPTADGLFALGMLYASDGEAESDLVAAHMWLNLAALHGNREAADHRQQIAREMSPAAVAEAQRAAREWLTTH